jgi:hypothetical protein
MASRGQANIDPLEILTLEDQEEEYSSESADEEEILVLETTLDLRVPWLSCDGEPGTLSVAFSDSLASLASLASPHSLAAGDKPVGRRFPWGFADPYDAEHCDFVRLTVVLLLGGRGGRRLSVAVEAVGSPALIPNHAAGLPLCSHSFLFPHIPPFFAAWHLARLLFMSYLLLFLFCLRITHSR